jgi:Uma2 family endonuclease
MASAIVAPPRPITPDSGKLYEVVNGQRREIPPMGALAGMVASMLSQYLGAFATQHRLGLVVVEVLFRLVGSGDKQRRPDVAFVGYGHLPDPALPPEDPPNWDVIPDLAVEVVSPTNTASEILDKIQDYFGSGVRLVWVVYPKHRQVYVYESLTQTAILRENDELDGGAVLPGFRLKIAALFAPLVKPQ